MDLKKVHKHPYFPHAAIALIIVLAVAVFALRSSGPHVQQGDSVSIWYTGSYENGTIFDTNIQTQAQKAGIYTTERKYEPFSFVVGQGQVIPGMDKAVLDMKAGQKKAVTILPEQGYGPRQEVQVVPFKRDINLPQSLRITYTVFSQAFQKIPVIGEQFSTPAFPWKMEVTAINRSIITLKNLAQVGQQFYLPRVNWTSDIIKVYNDTLFVRQNPKTGDLLYATGPQGQVQQGKIIYVDDSSYKVEVDPNHPLAGKSLVFTIELVTLQKKKA
ncbi:FKBP-type peptidyl-prolyl cis-trans isomerase [Candidatus Woesearchaeota archaeon]|nr:FKBP-type peptidyl-prolyl cis-trans isomerase [Candidatus Woesearchaeota archaeon]